MTTLGKTKTFDFKIRPGKDIETVSVNLPTPKAQKAFAKVRSKLHTWSSNNQKMTSIETDEENSLNGMKVKGVDAADLDQLAILFPQEAKLLRLLKPLAGDIIDRLDIENGRISSMLFDQGLFKVNIIKEVAELLKDVDKNKDTIREMLSPVF